MNGVGELAYERERSHVGAHQGISYSYGIAIERSTSRVSERTSHAARMLLLLRLLHLLSLHPSLITCLIISPNKGNYK